MTCRNTLVGTYLISHFPTNVERCHAALWKCTSLWKHTHVSLLIIILLLIPSIAEYASVLTLDLEITRKEQELADNNKNGVNVKKYC